MSDDNEPATGSHGMLRWAIQTAGVAGFVGLVAIQHFARADQNAPEPIRVAHAGARRTPADPETTGSITKDARAVRLDPCSLQSGSRGPRP